MAGRRQFDKDEALEKALKCFWQHGCEGTSMRDLEQATGLNKSSLYNTFGSKAQLLERSLERFSRQYTSRFFKHLRHRDIHQAIGGFVKTLNDRFTHSDLPAGCLATMAAMEKGGSDSDVSRAVAGELGSLKQQLLKRFEQAVKDGQLPDRTDCETLASLILAVTRGVAVIHRGSGDETTISNALNGVLALLENPPLKQVSRMQ